MPGHPLGFEKCTINAKFGKFGPLILGAFWGHFGGISAFQVFRHPQAFRTCVVPEFLTASTQFEAVLGVTLLLGILFVVALVFGDEQSSNLSCFARFLI